MTNLGTFYNMYSLPPVNELLTQCHLLNSKHVNCLSNEIKSVATMVYWL